MPSERIVVERILPTKWHFEYDSGPPGYERKVLDFPTLTEALAAVRDVAAKIEPADTAENSSVASFSADTAPAAATPTEAATPEGDVA